MNDEELNIPVPGDDEIPGYNALNTSEGSMPSAKAGKQRRKKKRPTTFKKAPQAPKRFKSSYIFFSVAKMEDMKKAGTKVTNASSKIAELWRNLPEKERTKWDEVAKKDKIRYMAEKALYTGPWQVPSKRVKKDPSAPKRPMSAFLFFSQGKRQQLKEQNPDMKNTEISTRLGEIWKSMSDDEKQPFKDREARERGQYKKDMSAWRSQRDSEEEAEKKRKEEIVEDFIKSGFVPGSEAPPMSVPAPDTALAQSTVPAQPALGATAVMPPQVPPPMGPGVMPFPPMPPIPIPQMPLPHSTDGSQQQKPASGQSGDQGIQQQIQPFYPGYYYPMYPYPYPMPMPVPVMAPSVYPAAPAQHESDGVGGAADASTDEHNEKGETV